MQELSAHKEVNSKEHSAVDHASLLAASIWKSAEHQKEGSSFAHSSSAGSIEKSKEKNSGHESPKDAHDKSNEQIAVERAAVEALKGAIKGGAAGAEKEEGKATHPNEGQKKLNKTTEQLDSNEIKKDLADRAKLHLPPISLSKD
jgi:hypothetical protein